MDPIPPSVPPTEPTSGPSSTTPVSSPVSFAGAEQADTKNVLPPRRPVSRWMVLIVLGLCLLMVLVGIAWWLMRSGGLPTSYEVLYDTESQVTVTPAPTVTVAPEAELRSGTEIEDIEADINDTTLSDLEAEFKDVESEINAYE